jgi:uncharacterized protein YbaR (Trm112 family)
MRRSLLDILACPIDKHYPLILHEFESQGEVVVNGLLECTECGRYYPIVDEIPIMLPDDLRKREEDLAFLERWKAKVPEHILYEGKPHHLERLG